jgi:hypothetical protein
LLRESNGTTAKPTKNIAAIYNIIGKANSFYLQISETYLNDSIIPVFEKYSLRYRGINPKSKILLPLNDLLKPPSFLSKIRESLMFTPYFY